jgi:hypothetical protein
MEKYYPLERHLSRVTSRTVTVTFDRIEKVIGDNLPASASKHRAWWANDATHVHALAWLKAGWRVDTVNADRRVVTFVSTR